MTQLYDGFESGNITPWTSTGSGTPTVVSSPVYAGTKAVRCNPSANEMRIYRTPSNSSKMGMRAWVRRSTAANETPILMDIYETPTCKLVYVQYDYNFAPNNLRMRWRNGSCVDTTLASTELPLDTWTLIEMAVDASANPWKIKFRVNGTEYGEYSAADTAATWNQPGIGAWAYSMTWDVHYDDWAAIDAYEYPSGATAPPGPPVPMLSAIGF